MSTRSTPTPEAGSDPLAHLHRMSTTAGVASQQYVAVNTAAVVAALLGIASALTIFSPLLLAIPVAGIVVSIVAWRQIGDSNGTETGKPAALLGLALSVLIGGGVAGKELLDYTRARSDGAQMDAIAGQLAEAIKADQFQKAYDLFDVDFRARFTAPQFEARLRATQAFNGRIQSMTWNRVQPAYEKMGGGSTLLGVISVAIRFDSGEGRFTFVYRKVADGWQLWNIVEMFPTEQPKKP